MKSDKMRKGSFWFLAIILAAAWPVASSSTSWADTQSHGHDKRPDAVCFRRHLLNAKETLGLSDEQEARLRTIAIGFKKERIKKTAEIKLAEIDMHQLLHGRDKQASREDIEAAVRSRYALKADRRIASIKAFQEARSVLTPGTAEKIEGTLL